MRVRPSSPFRWAAIALVVGLLAGALPADDKLAVPIATGQRVYSAGHSFHYFVQPILKNIADLAGVKGHKQVGLSAIGGSRVIQHWTTQTTIAKESNETPLPTETIHVGSTDRFAPAGQIKVQTNKGEAVVTYTGLKGRTFTGCTGGKGTLTAGKKVSQDDNAIRQALKTGKIDVLTLSPIYLPDPGIEDFVKLAIEHNPKIRIFVQENWLPWDHYDPSFKAPPGKIDHNAPTAESLHKTHAVYFKSLEDHVVELNKKYDTKAVHVAPVGQAVIALREKILAGAVPGIPKQNDLFVDAIGHPRPPIQALEGYVYYAAIYRKSPVGLPMPAVLAKNKNYDDKLNHLLQELAWVAVKNNPLAGVQIGAPKP